MLLRSILSPFGGTSGGRQHLQIGIILQPGSRFRGYWFSKGEYA